GDTLTCAGKAIVFFPATIGHLAGTIGWHALSIGADARYTGRIYVDNTESTANSIEPHTVLDLTGAARLRLGGATTEVSMRVLNALDQSYEASGYLDYDAAGILVPVFIPAATRNW